MMQHGRALLSCGFIVTSFYSDIYDQDFFSLVSAFARKEHKQKYRYVSTDDFFVILCICAFCPGKHISTLFGGQILQLDWISCADAKNNNLP